MTLRQRLLARAQRLLPYGIDAAGLVPAAVPGWGGSALAALPWPNPQGGHLLLRMQAQTQQALLEQGLAYLATARSARAPLPGCGARAHYRSWHRVGAGDLADPLAPPPAYRLLQRPGVAAAGGFFTCDQHGRHWLWLLPASAQIRLGWHQPQGPARWPRAARCG